MRYFLVFIFIVFAQHTFANNLSSFKSTCGELGFKKGTEKFGECVLKLRDKFNNQSNIESNSSIDRQYEEARRQAEYERQQMEREQARARQQQYEMREAERRALEQQAELLRQQQEMVKMRNLQNSLRMMGEGLNMMGY